MAARQIYFTSLIYGGSVEGLVSMTLCLLNPGLTSVPGRP